MTAEQFVLVGVARTRAAWASDLARWSTSGAAPIEFVKCLTPDEAAVVLGSGRRVSALLVDARSAGADRDLIGTAADAGVPTLVISDRTVHRDWDALGVTAVIEHDPDPRALLDTLARHCTPVDRSRRTARSRLDPDPDTSRPGRLVAVLGTGGSGSSTVAMALAQALASAAVGRVVLVDGGHRNDLAMYHDVGDVLPGLPELVEAHRSDRLDPEEVRRLTFPIPSRGYSVLLGRRRRADWVTLRRRSVDAAIESLGRSFDLTIIDATADLDGQSLTGSADVEDRHAVALAATASADLTLVTGRADLHGLHALVDLLGEVLATGVPADRVVPVLVGVPRSPATRARLTAATSRLAAVGPQGDGASDQLQPPLMLPRVRQLDDRHDRVAPLPISLCAPAGHRIERLLGSLDHRVPASKADRIRVGELATDADPWDGPTSEVA